ncbi:MAG TPA: glycosyltransferase family A protein [Actinocrinis sp.]|nr:glycosyltransferase family A protein [Actinocrinis sp.]
MDPRALIRPVKRIVRRHYGWLPLYELRNKVRYGHTVPRVWLFERAEARRLRSTLTQLQPSTSTSPPPLVTTVIPTYRRPDGLAAAVRSALDQTVRDHLVIVVDDGGGLPDELPQDPRLIAVSLAHNTHVLGVVRNVGIRLARSQYVAFLDDDNSWEPNHLETALGVLGKESKRDLQGVYTAMRRVFPDGRELDILSVPYDRHAAREDGFLDANAFVGRRSRALWFSRMRRDLGVLPREDWATFYRYSRRHPIRHIPIPTVRYLVNPDTYYTVWGPEADAADTSTATATATHTTNTANA